MLKLFNPAEESAAHARAEFNAMRACAHSAIPEAIALDLTCERPCLVIERVSGINLTSRITSSGPLEIQAALELAIQCAEALCAVHRARLVHRDVTPNNVLVATETNETHLIDFGIAATVGTTTSGAAGEAQAAGGTGTLLFIAPEQTGRMNRGCGFQSDLYGLGATLYFALTGKPPFEFEDPLELIHAHIARQPVPPSTLNSKIPEPLSCLILKLLAKEPGERYASATSLGCDLVAMHEQWMRHGRVDRDFELEATEIPDRPRYPSKLYGRECESEILWEQLVQSISEGPRVIFLEGAVGSGKSSLVDALRSRLGEVGAYLLHGHFDASRERAYAGFVTCLESFAEQVLVENDARLAQWRRGLLAKLGNLGAALTDWVPDLGAVLGDVAALPALGPRETRARVLLALQRFLSAASTSDHPIVLFLDDFQDSDPASRALFEDLFTSELAGALLVIIACRDQEQASRKMLESTRARLRELGVTIEKVELQSLRSQALLEFLEGTFGKPPDVIAPLAEHIERKTGGNPLWVRQLIDHLHAQGWIGFEIGSGWGWQLEIIAGARVPDGATGLLVAKLEGLPTELRETLHWASCASQGFGPDLLARLGETSPERIAQSLLELERLGLVVPASVGFRFAHDRIREVASEGLAPEKRATLHTRVALWLLEELPESEHTAHRLEIADHLVLAEGALPPDLHAARIEWCLAAGREVLQGGAATGARRYLDVARRDFAEPDWVDRHAVGMALWLSSADSVLLAGDPQGALALLDEVQPRIRTEIERAQLATQRLNAMSLIKPAEECVAHALQVLRRWGVRWPMHPSWLRTWFALRCSYGRILRRAQQGVDAPEGSLSPERLAALMVFGALGGVLARTDIRLVAIATAFALEKPMPKSLAMREAYSAGHYGAWLQVVLGDTKRSAAVAAAAQVWIQETGDTVYAPRLDANLRFTLHVIHMRRRRALAGIDASVERLQENGDVEFAYYGQFLKAYFGILGGESLPVALKQLATVVATVQRMGSRLPDSELSLQALLWLAEREYSLAALDADVRNVERRLKEDASAAEAWESTLWTLVLCIHGQHELAWRISEPAQVALFRRSPYVHVPHHILYRGIAAASLAESTGKRIYRRSLRRAVRLLERWATFGPDFPHMLLLLQAEQARVKRKLDRAYTLYEQAARGALSQEFVHHAALAKERRAELLLRSRRATDARESLRQAIQLYENWGASPKVSVLQETHADLLRV